MAVYLEEFIDSIENLPHELKHHLEEVRGRDELYHELRKSILIAQKSYLNKDWNNEEMAKSIQEKYRQAKHLCDDKISLSETAIDLINRHMKRLDEQIAQAIKNVDEATLQSASYDPQPITLSRSGRPSGGFSASRRSQPRSRRAAGSSDDSESSVDDEDEDSAAEEAVYCICQQVSFGEMIACDNAANCPYEWFHYECVGLNEPPKGTWYCPVCAPRMKKRQ